EHLETNIVVTTTRRVYHLQASSGDWYMPAVAWHYPEEDEALRQAQIERTKDDEPLSRSPEKLEFNYEIVEDGESWAPVRCFDDGEKSYIQMPKDIRSGEAPALFLVEKDSEPILVNYRVRGSYYILDRLFDRAELRVGKADPVVIYSPRAPRSFWERIF
ncbi:MAG TPA: TrbG/VirB9 family P-type conjugative transfer protein, partial [Oligoflexia bacterium]|nr:TrbG/VirB9 family P-type conjugative transfer protein [Oligoflexia bacterium]